MFFIWNDDKSFQQHSRGTKGFSEAHIIGTPEELRLLKSLSISLDVQPKWQTGTLMSFTRPEGKTITVPIWKTEPARGSQN